MDGYQKIFFVIQGRFPKNLRLIGLEIKDRFLVNFSQF